MYPSDKYNLKGICDDSDDRSYITRKGKKKEYYRVTCHYPKLAIAAHKISYTLPYWSYQKKGARGKIRATKSVYSLALMAKP